MIVYLQSEGEDPVLFYRHIHQIKIIKIYDKNVVKNSLTFSIFKIINDRWIVIYPLDSDLSGG